MANCFWNLCDCPIEQPCPEHYGEGCSLIDGKAIDVETGVNDPLTRFVEAAIAKLEHDVHRVNEIHKTLEDRKAQLEKEKADLERQAQAAKTRAGRQAVVDEERAIAKRHDQLEAEIRALATEILGLGASYAAAYARISAALITPFDDPDGYCSCYNAKTASLQKLDSQIKIEQGNLAAAITTLNTVKGLALPQLAITFAIGTAVFVYLYFYVTLGILYGLVVAAFIAEIAVAIGVIIICIELYLAKRAVLQSQIALLKLMLSYYRIQQIPTCVLSPDFEDGCDDGEGNGGENGGEAK